LGGFATRAGAVLDIAATVALVCSIGAFGLLAADVLRPPPGTIGAHPGGFLALVRPMIFLGLLSFPTICCAIDWPIHLRQKRRGLRVFGWLRVVVLAASLWMWWVLAAVNAL